LAIPTCMRSASAGGVEVDLWVLQSEQRLLHRELREPGRPFGIVRIQEAPGPLWPSSVNASFQARLWASAPIAGIHPKSARGWHDMRGVANEKTRALPGKRPANARSTCPGQDTENFDAKSGIPIAARMISRQRSRREVLGGLAPCSGSYVT